MKKARRRRRWLLVIGLTVLVFLSTGFAVLRIKFEGEPLGDKIAGILNKKMRGRIEIGSIEWDTTSLKKVVTGGWVPVTVHKVRIWDDCALSGVAGALDEVRFGNPIEDCTPDDRPDPDPKSKRKPRKLLVDTERLTAEIDIHALMFGNHDFVFRNLWVHGGEALIEQTDEPYPLHAYDRTIVSIVSAFYPRIPPGFRAGITASSAPPIFDLRDIHVSNLNLTVHMHPYTDDDTKLPAFVTAIRLEGVDVDSGPDRKNDSYLYMDGRDPLLAKFYVRLSATAKRGTMRIKEVGARDTFRIPYVGALEPEVYPPKGRAALYQLNLTDIKLNRLAQLPTEWARKNYVANTLELDLEAKTTPCHDAGKDKTGKDDPAQNSYLHLSGELHNWFDRPFDGQWNLALDGTNLGPTIRSCMKDNVGGDDLKARLTLTGPFVASPAIGLDLKNLDYDIPLREGEEPLRLTLAEVQGRIDMVNEQGYIDKTKALIRGGKEPGEVDVSATFGLRPLNASTNIEIVKAIDVGRFLPPRVAGPVGKYLQGRLRAKGDTEFGFALEDFDLALGPTPTQKAVRVHSGRLFTDNAFAKIQIQKVMVDAGRTHATVDGWIDYKKPDSDLYIRGEAPDLKQWLDRFGIDLPILSAGGGVIHITGPLDKARINIATELGGVPCLDKVRINDMDYSADTRIADIKSLSSAGLGGELTGNIRIRTGETKNDLNVIESLKLNGKRLDASRLCGLKGTVKGTLDSVEVEIQNTSIDKNRTGVQWLEHIRAYAHADKLTVLGDKYSLVNVCVNRKDDKLCRSRSSYLDTDDLQQCEQGKKGNGFCGVATAQRDAGGRLDATVAKLAPTKRGLPDRIGGSIALEDVPLTIIKQFTNKFDNQAGGSLSTTLHLQGSSTQPQADGVLHLLRSWTKDAFLGDATLQIVPTQLEGKPAVQLRGTALANRLGINATIGTVAPYPVELQLTGRRVEADTIIDLQKLLHVDEPLSAWVSGTVTVRTELAPPTPVEPEAWIELTEVHASITHRSADGHLIPLEINVENDDKTRAPVSIYATPTTVELACKDKSKSTGRVPCSTFISTPAGKIEITGNATRNRIAIAARGDLDFRKIAPLVDTLLEKVQGTAELTASITGTFDKPNYEAELRLKDVSAQRSETILEAPSGLIRIANGSLGFTDVRVRVKDARRDESGEVHIKGAIRLDGIKPVEWGVLIDGKVAGKMLLVVAPTAISSAAGLARIEGDLMLFGKGPRPTISGTIDFGPLPPCPPNAPDPDQCRGPRERHVPLSIIPRGVHREFVFQSGTVDIDTEVNAADKRTYKIAVNQVAAKIDGEGELSGIDGNIDVREGTLTHLDVRLDADKIPFRVPGTLDLVLTGRNLHINQDNEDSSPEVEGTITLVDGTYTRNFVLADQIVSIGKVSTPSRPFWEEYPAIGKTNLRLAIKIERFLVKNNIAEIEFGGDLAIKDSPKEPKISGRIAVRRGRFRIPGMRAAFEQTNGFLDFVEKPSNPEVYVKSEAQFRDLSGQDHQITLEIKGKLEELTWDLYTSTGYNKSQTLSLLVLGRNQEQLRRSLGDQSLGTVDPTSGDVSTNPSSGVTDQIVKDLAGDWVSGLLGDSLTRITGLDVFRIDVAFGSIGLHIEKNVLDNMKLIVDSEQTIRGSTVNPRGELTLTPRVSAQVGYLSKNFNDAAEQDIQDTSAKLVLKIFFGEP